MNIGVIGSGVVAQTLAAGFAKHGHKVVIGTREPAKLADWGKTNPGIRIADFAETAKAGQVVVLAVKGAVVAQAVRQAGVSNLAGKPVIDATNPIADSPPVNGVLSYTTDLNQSMMEKLQQEFPAVHFVKAFNSVGAGKMVNPQYSAGRPTMFLCGNNDEAKKTVAGLCDQLGWEVADMGKVEAARAIEPLAMLWCIPGFTRNEWTHAFKLLR